MTRLNPSAPRLLYAALTQRPNVDRSTVHAHVLGHFTRHLSRRAAAPCKLLSIPGPAWGFERQLSTAVGAHNIYFVAVESDPRIFKIACRLPLEGAVTLGYHKLGGPIKLAATARSRRSFLLNATLHQALTHPNQSKQLRAAFSEIDGAWLDTSHKIAAPLEELLLALPQRFNTSRRQIPIGITIMAARESGDRRTWISTHGRGLWLQSTLQAGSDAANLPWQLRIEAEYPYRSADRGAPMLCTTLTAQQP